MKELLPCFYFFGDAGEDGDELVVFVEEVGEAFFFDYFCFSEEFEPVTCLFAFSPRGHPKMLPPLRFGGSCATISELSLSFILHPFPKLPNGRLFWSLHGGVCLRELIWLLPFRSP